MAERSPRSPPSASSTAFPCNARDGSPQQDFAPTGTRDSEGNRSHAEVRLNIYHCDPLTGYLNKVMLDRRDIGIYHVGVEVFQEEWSFQYYEDSWDDPSVSGLIRCHPKMMPEYEYQDTISLGPTPLSEDEVDEILLRFQYDYSSSTYHLTRRNCITFAYDLVQHLKTPTPFPDKLKGICDYASSSGGLDATVDYGWSWAKWYMTRKHQPENEQSDADAQNSFFCCAAQGAERQSSMWSLFLPPNRCSGKMCPGGPRGKIEFEEQYIREGYAKHDDQASVPGPGQFPARTQSSPSHPMGVSR